MTDLKAELPENHSTEYIFHKPDGKDFDLAGEPIERIARELGGLDSEDPVSEDRFQNIEDITGARHTTWRIKTEGPTVNLSSQRSNAGSPEEMMSRSSLRINSGSLNVEIGVLAGIEIDPNEAGVVTFLSRPTEGDQGARLSISRSGKVVLQPPAERIT